MKTEREKAIELFSSDPRKALQFCKKWHDLGEKQGEIVRGAECVKNGHFYRQLGFNPDEEVSRAIGFLGVHLGVG